MDHESRARRNAGDAPSELDRRYERIGALEGDARPQGSGRARRTIEDCIRETEEYRRLGKSVTCRPTWEALDQARREIGAQLKG